MLKIAIVGNIASGKSTIENYIRELGYTVYDSDKISHDILAGSFAVRKMFADDDILTNGQIDRKKLGAIVFKDKEKMKLLELILHPQIVTELLKIFQGKEDIIFVSVPQLFEANFEKLFDKIIFVTADKDIRLERLMKRNNLSEEDALLRINAQIPDSEKIQKCDYVIENNGNLEELKNKINEMISICLKA